MLCADPVTRAVAPIECHPSERCPTSSRTRQHHERLPAAAYARAESRPTRFDQFSLVHLAVPATAATVHAIPVDLDLDREPDPDPPPVQL